MPGSWSSLAVCLAISAMGTPTRRGRFTLGPMLRAMGRGEKGGGEGVGAPHRIRICVNGWSSVACLRKLLCFLNAMIRDGFELKIENRQSPASAESVALEPIGAQHRPGRENGAVAAGP